MKITFRQMVKSGVFLLLLASIPFYAVAEFNRGGHLNTRAQGKVNKTLAKSFLQRGAQGMQQNRSQVNIGSRRAGTCTMNIGTTNNKNTKEIIVTTKEIINYCGR
jgi:hypothetical protein